MPRPVWGIMVACPTPYPLDTDDLPLDDPVTRIAIYVFILDAIPTPPFSPYAHEYFKPFSTPDTINGSSAPLSRTSASGSMPSPSSQRVIRQHGIQFTPFPAFSLSSRQIRNACV